MATATQKGRSTTSRAKQASKGKAAAAKNGAGPGKRELAHKRDLELAPKVKQMRDQGKSWSDIKDKLGIDQPKGQVLIKMASIKPADRITAKNDADLGKKVVAARDKQELSWADIAVRAGITMGKVKALYTATSGKDAAESRVGRKETPAKAKPAARKRGATAKPAAKGKAALKRRRQAAKADPSR